MAVFVACGALVSQFPAIIDSMIAQTRIFYRVSKDTLLPAYLSVVD